MIIKTTQTIEVSADRLMSGGYSDEEILSARKGDNPVDEMTLTAIEELDILQAEKPSDIVSISLSNGELLYDILSFHRKKHTAPLLVMRQEASLKELFETVENKSIEAIVLSYEDSEILSKVMADDDLWNSTPFHVKASSGVYIRVSVAGVFLFRNVINSLIDAVNKNP